MIINNNLSKTGYAPLSNRTASKQDLSFGLNLKSFNKGGKYNDKLVAVLEESTNIGFGALASYIADVPLWKGYIYSKGMTESLMTAKAALLSNGNFDKARKLVKEKTPTSIYRPILAIIDKTVDKLVPKRKF